MWSYFNPVNIIFGNGALNQLKNELKGRSYVLVTYSNAPFFEYKERVTQLCGEPAILIDDVQPNPDFTHFEQQCEKWQSYLRQAGNQNNNDEPEVIVALGGGSVMDTAKVLASAKGDFSQVKDCLENNKLPPSSDVSIIAIPTTAGTGSEVTCWATAWHADQGKKYSLAANDLYAESAIIDPDLTVNLPKDITISTALDALSHALESIWNKNTNPISAHYATFAVKEILTYLPLLVKELDNLHYRTRIAKAAMLAGLAFSNTKTALAHNISYPVTLHYGVPHGYACSFTLPAILRGVIGLNETCDHVLKDIFGENLHVGILKLEDFFRTLDVSTQYHDYGIEKKAWIDFVDQAFSGERGLNFIGDKTTMLQRNNWR